MSRTAVYPPSHFEDVREWLLDEDAVTTEWGVLLRLRQQHNPTRSEAGSARPRAHAERADDGVGTGRVAGAMMGA